MSFLRQQTYVTSLVDVMFVWSAVVCVFFYIYFIYSNIPPYLLYFPFFFTVRSGYETYVKKEKRQIVNIAVYDETTAEWIKNLFCLTLL